MAKTTRVNKKDFVHRDSRDISPALVFYLGDFSPCYLVCFDERKEKEIGVLGLPYRMGMFDPRLPHMVHRSKDFRGSRYCVIFFKMWDTSAKLAPFEVNPRYLDEENIFSQKPLESLERSATPSSMSPSTFCSASSGKSWTVCRQGSLLIFKKVLEKEER